MRTRFALGTLAQAAVHRLVAAAAEETRRSRTTHSGIGLAVLAKETCYAVTEVTER